MHISRLVFIISALFIVLTTSSCDKSVHKMEIVRDCTGTYLRTKGGTDFFVCNGTILDSYNSGTKVKIRYDELNECFGILEPITCELEHVYEAKIEITEIL